MFFAVTADPPAVTEAPHDEVTCCPFANVQVTVQPLMALLPAVIRTSPTAGWSKATVIAVPSSRRRCKSMVPPSMSHRTVPDTPRLSRTSVKTTVSVAVVSPPVPQPPFDCGTTVLSDGGTVGFVVGTATLRDEEPSQALDLMRLLDARRVAVVVPLSRLDEPAVGAERQEPQVEPRVGAVEEQRVQPGGREDPPGRSGIADRIGPTDAGHVWHAE